MILELTFALALTMSATDDVAPLPICGIGQESVPFEDGYICGPADLADPDPTPSPTFTSGPAPFPNPAPIPPAAPHASRTAAPTVVPTPPQLAETGATEAQRSLARLAGIAAGGAIVIGSLLLLTRRGGRR